MVFTLSPMTNASCIFGPLFLKIHLLLLSVLKCAAKANFSMDATSEPKQGGNKDISQVK